MTNDILNALRDLLKCHDLVHSSTSPISAEITMWRKKFLESCPEWAFTDDREFYEKSFMAMPCDVFSTHSPDDLITRISEEKKKKEQEELSDESK